ALRRVGDTSAFLRRRSPFFHPEACGRRTRHHHAAPVLEQRCSDQYLSVHPGLGGRPCGGGCVSFPLVRHSIRARAPLAAAALESPIRRPARPEAGGAVPPRAVSPSPSEGGPAEQAEVRATLQLVHEECPQQAQTAPYA